MKFVLFRHAHKGNSPFDDPELSKQGYDQAANLLQLINENVIPKPSQLLVSPKRRTSQTFYAISKEFNIPKKIQNGLDQRGENETQAKFRHRISEFLKQVEQINQSEAVMYASRGKRSHRRIARALPSAAATTVRSLHSRCTDPLVVYRTQ